MDYPFRLLRPTAVEGQAPHVLTDAVHVPALEKFIGEIGGYVAMPDKDMSALAIFDSGIPEFCLMAGAYFFLVLTGPPYPVSNG